jgi:hypothetical protein
LPESVRVADAALEEYGDLESVNSAVVFLADKGKSARARVRVVTGGSPVSQKLTVPF